MAKAQQVGLFDKTIEDKEIAALLADACELEEAATDFKTKKKSARKLIEERFPEAVNVDGDNGGWVRVGGHRFQMKKRERSAGEVTIGAGFNYTFNFERI